MSSSHQQIIAMPTAAGSKVVSADHHFGSKIPLAEPYW
jgi:hypothetical protein